MGLAAVAMFIAFLFFAESYRWLIKNDRREDEEALASLLFFNKDPEMIQDMLERLKELAEKEKSSTGTSSSYILSTCICVTVCSKQKDHIFFSVAYRTIGYTVTWLLLYVIVA